ncbi:MAG: hypothetical protein IJB02_01190 [Oscillospiraceae bacterium]|nr:hypothetical protein [Oscillospiraceae bacterium]
MPQINFFVSWTNNPSERKEAIKNNKNNPAKITEVINRTGIFNFSAVSLFFFFAVVVARFFRESATARSACVFFFFLAIKSTSHYKSK